MNIDRDKLEELREKYPAGCRIVLDHMDDPYRDMRPGMQGVVKGVDDTGSVMTTWDEGGSLSVLYDVDRCHLIETDEECLITLNWYGRHQKDEDALCPRCGERMEGKTSRQALSRYADIMVCPGCGIAEALEAAEIIQKKPLLEWEAIRVPRKGSGGWEMR